MAALGTIKLCKVVKHCPDRGVFGTQRLLSDAQCAPIKWLGIRKLTLLSIKLSQAMKRVSHLYVTGPKGLLLDRQCALEELLSFGGAIERLIEDAEVAEPGGIELVLLTVLGRRHADIFFGDGNRFCVFPRLIELQAPFVDCFQLWRLLLRLDMQERQGQQHKDAR